MWRLVFDEHSSVTYADASLMDVDTLCEANAALDIYIGQKNKANKPKGGKK